MGSRPYRNSTKTFLESANEFVVLLLLMITNMMFIAIESIKDTEQGLKVYENFGFCFTILLLMCIVINFVRILRGMCGQAKAKYARKLRQFDSRAAAYDKSMNLVEGSRQCNCACIECSHVALKKYKRKHFRSNWAPVQPRYFQLRLKECKLEQSNSFKHLV